MKLLYSWPLWLLLCIPAILLLYLLKQKALDNQVSSLYLWREVYRNMESQTPWEKLKHNLLLYLQLLLALLLILSMAGPYRNQAGQERKNVILIMDNSGSMNAAAYGKETRLSRGKKQAVEYIGSLNSKDRVTIIIGSDTAAIAMAGSNDWKQVKSVIEGIKPTDKAGDLSEAVSLAMSMASQWESYEALVFSDKGVDMGTLHGTLVDVGTGGCNGGVDFVSHSYNKEGILSIMAKITNYGDVEINSDINLYLGDTLLEVQPISLLPGAEEIVIFQPDEKDYEPLKEKEDILKVEINQKDALMADNIAYDKLEKNGRPKVLLVSEQNVFLEKAVLTNEDLILYKTTAVEHLEGEEAFDLIIFDGQIPKRLPQKGNLLFLNPPETLPDQFSLFQVEKEETGTYVASRENEITRYLEDFTFGVDSYKKIKKPFWGEGFLYGGEDCVGFGGNVSGRYVAVLAFDIHNSDLPLKAEFPVLIYNLVNRCIETGIARTSINKVGDAIELAGTANAERVSVSDPQGRETAIFTGKETKAAYQMEFAGLYQLKRITEKGEDTQTIGANFPTASESRLREEGVTAAGEEKDQTKKNGMESNMGGQSMKNWLILLTLVILLAEWMVYIKRT